jgi:hypothetical protein
MEGLVLFLVFVAVCACVFLVFKTFKRVGEVQEEVAGLMRIPMGVGLERAPQVESVTPSGMPMSGVGNDTSGSIMQNFTEDDMQKIIRMVAQSQGGK